MGVFDGERGFPGKDIFLQGKPPQNRFYTGLGIRRPTPGEID